ncbi:MAG: PHB depolymerase family esterase [Pseudomonadota bacterium]
MAADFQKFMAEATRLTRAGDLHAATALIQQALSERRFAAEAPPAQGDVIDIVAREVTPAEPAILLPLSPLQPLPEGPVQAPPAGQGHVEAGRFGQGRAARDFKLFVPPRGARPGRKPLVVMLHGCTQNPDDFAAGTRMNELARAQGIYVLYPAQSRQANPQGCWNWFKASHQQRSRGEPALLAGMTRWVIEHHDIDPSQVYVAGLSAGGAMAAILGQAYPDLFAAVGVHSGLPPAAAKDLPGALAAMKGQGGHAQGALRVPTIVFHGDADPTVHPCNGEQLFAAAPGERHTLRRDTVRVHGARRSATRHRRTRADGKVVAEHWVVHGSGHAWSGGHHAGSHCDPEGPDASAEMLRFFLEHRLDKGR